MHSIRVCAWMILETVLVMHFKTCHVSVHIMAKVTGIGHAQYVNEDVTCTATSISLFARIHDIRLSS